MSGRALVRRQAVRRTLLPLSFIAFPITMNYLSPYLIVDSAFHGIVNGSLRVFTSMFVGSLVRHWSRERIEPSVHVTIS